MKIFYTLSFLFLTFIAQAQQGLPPDTKSGTIAIGSGISLYAIKDYDISNAKYSGTLTAINLSWSSPINERQIRDFYFNVNTGMINNVNAEARVNELALGWDYCFNLSTQRKHIVFLGPAPLFYFHDRKQTFSQTTSSFGMASFAAVSGIKSNNLPGVNYKITGRLGLLSAALNTEGSPATKILTPLNGFQFLFSAQTSYALNDWAHVCLKYSFQSYHISAWDKFYALSDQLSFNILCSF